MQTNFSEIPEGLVLRPSEAEFVNFREYIHQVEADPSMKEFGILKVKVTRSSPPNPS